MTKIDIEALKKALVEGATTFTTTKNLAACEQTAMGCIS
jgi:hypothetical protein